MKRVPQGGLCSRVPFKILTLFPRSRPKFHLVPLLHFQDYILSLILCTYVLTNQTEQNKITDHYFFDIFDLFDFVKVFHNKNLNKS